MKLKELNKIARDLAGDDADELDLFVVHHNSKGDGVIGAMTFSEVGIDGHGSCYIQLIRKVTTLQ